MRVSLNEIDPEIARVLSESPRVSRLIGAEDTVSFRKRDASFFWFFIVKACVWVGLGLWIRTFTLPPAYVAPPAIAEKLTFFVPLAMFISAAFSICVAIVYRRNKRKRLRQHFERKARREVEGKVSYNSKAVITSVVWETLLGYLSLTRMEKIYAEGLGSLLKAGEQKRVSDVEGRKLLEHLNNLLESDRQLAKQRRVLKELTASGVVKDLEEKEAELAKRIKNAKDVVAKDALVRSREMLATRREHLQDSETLKERVEAQREMLEQTLSTLASGIRRMQMMSTGAEMPDVDEVQAVVAQVHRQAQAVEAAVAEVTALRLGG